MSQAEKTIGYDYVFPKFILHYSDIDSERCSMPFQSYRNFCVHHMSRVRHFKIIHNTSEQMTDRQTDV